MPLHCTMVDAGRQIGGHPIRRYKPPPYPPFLWTNQAAIRQDVEETDGQLGECPPLPSTVGFPRFGKIKKRVSYYSADPAGLRSDHLPYLAS